MGLRLVLGWVVAAGIGAAGMWWFQRARCGEAEDPLPVASRSEPSPAGPPPAPVLEGSRSLVGTSAPAAAAPAVATAGSATPGPAEWHRQISEREQTIRELRTEVERLRGTLPSADILRELSRASVEELEGVGRALRMAAEERLLKPSEAWASRHATFLQRDGSGLARILPRGRFDALVEKRGGGAYWSFVKRDNSYDKSPDLELQQGMFSSGFAGGDDGILLDLGETELAAVEADPRQAPRVLEAADREGWPRLFEERPKDMRASEFVRRLPGKDRVKSVTGHTYVLRSIREQDHDVLVAFTVLDADEHGQTLLWSILRRWEPWDLRRR